MEQLNMQDLLNLCNKLKGEGLDLSTLPVYLGDDDELNGIHCAWYCEAIDKGNPNEDTQYYIDMINERTGNNKLEKRGVLIS